MPLVPEELLKKLGDATIEATNTIRLLHEARSEALTVIKDWKKTVRETIAAEVADAVMEISDEARAQMQQGADQIILSLDAAWREKLGLADG